MLQPEINASHRRVALITFFKFLLVTMTQSLGTTTVADGYDSIVAYDAPDGDILYFYETRRDDVCRPTPDFGSGAMPFGVGYHYFYDSTVKWSRQVEGAYECADECYRNDCKEFKLIQPYYSGSGQRPLPSCILLWKGCFNGKLEAPIVAGGIGSNQEELTGEVMKFDNQRIYKPNALYTYFTKSTSSYCDSGADLFSGGLPGYSPEACASLCLFYTTKICAAFAFDTDANRCHLKTVNCSDTGAGQSGSSKINSEWPTMAKTQNKKKLEFYVRRPWLSGNYELRDLMRFDQTECTHALPGVPSNFTSPDEPAQLCRKEANCVGFQCFQYCNDENRPSPWECTDWDPDVLPYECTFVLSNTPCMPGYNDVPGRRATLFVRHNFKYTRPFVATEFYRVRRTTTRTPPSLKWRRSRQHGDGDVNDGRLKMRKIRKAARKMRRLLRLARMSPIERREFRRQRRERKLARRMRNGYFRQIIA